MEPWEVQGVPWKTEAAYWSWVRGVLRKGWSRHPVKLEYIKQNRHKIPNPNPNGKAATIWGMTCASCSNDFPVSMAKKTRDRVKAEYNTDIVCIEINHKNAASSLRCKEDLEGFAGRLLYVNLDDLEPLCKTCHGIHTYAERMGITFEEAVIEKEVIAFGKLKIKEQKSILAEHYTEVEDGNEKARKQAYRQYLKENT